MSMFPKNFVPRNLFCYDKSRVENYFFGDSEDKQERGEEKEEIN